MPNPIEVITRLFRRGSASAVVAEIYAKAVNQPLFVHPSIGEMIVQGYLHSDINQLRGDSGRRGENQAEATVGILDISGALVARETPGICGMGPLSYEEIRRDFDILMTDSNIKTIIGRFDTPGGMAAQNMDLADHIYASRGQGKRLIAMVDDMAYSAGFALASAFEEIWITRTGGVGSVGVVSYHVDQSDFNNKLGVRIEYLYAGANKIDGNPHEPLTDGARERFMGEISRLYNLFAATTARNLGMSVDAVKATEAGTFHGDKAIEAGFAHKIGTFSDLLQSLIPSGENSVVVVTMEDQNGVYEQNLSHLNTNEGTPLIVVNETDPKSIMISLNANPELIKEVINASKPKPFFFGQSETDDDTDNSEGSDDETENEDEQARRTSEIKAICAAAKRPEAAEHFIAAGTPVDQVRETLFTAITAGQHEINGTTPITLVTNKTEQSVSGWKQAHAKARALSHLN